MPPDAFFCFFAVAVMVDVFSDLLTSAAVGPAIGGDGRPDNTGICVVLINPAYFMDMDAFRTSMDA